MNRHNLTRRLAVLVGEGEAYDLLQAPNAVLDGRIPQDLIDAGDLAPVEILIREMEAREASRLAFITQPVRNFDDDLAADPLLDRLPQRRHSRGAGRIFAILDEIERGGSK